MDQVHYFSIKRGLQSIRDVADHFLMTYSELDHYQGRSAARYEGVILSADDGLNPEWPADGDDPRRAG